MDFKRQLPNATTVMVLGILSIVTCFCYGIIGIVLGIIALVLAKKDMQLYQADPEGYDNYSNLNTGRICAIIGISVGSLVLVLGILYVAFIMSMVFPAITAAAAH